MKRGRTTIWRELTVLEHIGMVRTRAKRGNQKSECWLVKLKKMTVSLGASHSRKAASYVLAPSRVEKLRNQIATLQSAMEAKQRACREFPPASGENLAKMVRAERECANRTARR
jgi:hypothetical protein